MSTRMDQLGLNLTVDEINRILDALGQRPYAEVCALIDKIKAQAEAQLRIGRAASETRPPPSEGEQA